MPASASSPSPRRGASQRAALAPVPDTVPTREAGFVPFDKDAEIAVVSAVLTSTSALDEVSDIVTSADFAVDKLAAVYGAAVAVEAGGEPVSVITVADRLRKSALLDVAGGVEALRWLADQGVGVANVAAYARIVAEKAVLRRLLDAGRHIATTAAAPHADAEEALTEAEQTVFALGAKRDSTSLTPMSKAVPAMLAQMEQTRSALLLGHSTGFPSLDKLTGGFTGGQLVVVAARPGMGKSAWAAQVAHHIAASTGKTVPLLSYEMSVSEIMMRLLAQQLRYDLRKVQRGDLPAGMDADIARIAETMTDLPLLIDDNPPESIGAVRAAMRRLARRADLGAIVVDYLQLMSGDGRRKDDTRASEVGEISRGLKRLASELDVPIIALSQLNRGLEARANKRPMLSDLRDSGAVEQDASIVLFIYRDAVYNPAADPAEAELILAKQRSGPQGVVPMRFTSHATRFDDLGRANETHAPSGFNPAPGGGFGGRNPF